MEEFDRGFAALQTRGGGGGGQPRQRAGASSSRGVARSAARIPVQAGTGWLDALGRPRFSGALTGSWLAGPLDSRGVVCEASDRNILCMSVFGTEVVLGGADHALYVYDINIGA